jgi:hypothetical protein
MQCDSDVTSRVQGACISTLDALTVGYSRSMQHIITSASTATVRMRVEPARRARDQFNPATDDGLGGFKGIAVGVLLGVVSWVFLLGLYFLI